MEKNIILKATATKMLKLAGAERVSEDAAKALVGVLEEVGRTIGEQAVKISGHSGRKTVQDGDVKLAAKI